MSAPSSQSILLLIALSSPQNNNHSASLSSYQSHLSNPSLLPPLLLELIRILSHSSFTSLPQNTLLEIKQADVLSFNEIVLKEQVAWNEQLRPMSGLLLKNAFRKEASHIILPEDTASEIRHGLLLALSDSEKSVRNAASSCISLILSRRLPLSTNWWEEIMIRFKHSLDTCPEHSDGVLSTCVKIVEDSKSMEDIVKVSTLVPSLFVILSGPPNLYSVPILVNSLAILMGLIEPMPTVLSVSILEYMAILSRLSAHSEETVRAKVCQSIVSLLCIRTEYLGPHLVSISDFILRTMESDTSASVKLEATEFWLTFSSLEEDRCTPQMTEAVQGMFPRLLPILLQNMVHPTLKQEEILAENIDQQTRHAHEDNTIVHHRSKHSKIAADDSDDESDPQTDHDDENEWSLRKCSAASLDALSNAYGADPLLPPLLPTLSGGLKHPDPWVREASILALGAVAEGCEHEISQHHMPELQPFLVAQLRDGEGIPQLRSITAWCLSRYAAYTVESGTVRGVVEGLMNSLSDRHPHVRLAGCSCFGILVEAAVEGDDRTMEELLKPILNHLIPAFTAETDFKARAGFLDVLAILADSYPDQMRAQDMRDIYIPVLVQTWTNTGSASPARWLDRNLLPMMECVASIALACGLDFQLYAKNVLDNCMLTIDACILHLSSQPNPTEEESDPIVCALDVLDGMLEGMEGDNFLLLVQSTHYAQNFWNVIVGISQYEFPGVRMSIFALVGDLARLAPTAYSVDVINPILNQLIRSMDPRYPSVCNNAVWATGEVLSKIPNMLQLLKENNHHHSHQILSQLIPLLMGNGDQNHIPIPGLPENASACLGRLAKLDPDFVSNEYARFFTGWCEGLARIADPIERRDGFQGMILCLQANPNGILGSDDEVWRRQSNISALIFAVVSWHVVPKQNGHEEEEEEGVTVQMLRNPNKFDLAPFPAEDEDLRRVFGDVLREIARVLGEGVWEELKRSMPVAVRKLLREVHQV